MSRPGWTVLQRHRGHAGAVGRFAWSPNSDRIAVPDLSGRVVVWDLQHAAPRHVIEVGRPATAVSWSLDAGKIAVAVKDLDPVVGSMDWMDDVGAWDQQLDSDDSALSEAGFTETAAGGLTVRIFDVASQLQVASLPAGTSGRAPDDIMWGPRDEQLTVATGEHVAEWDPYSGHRRATLLEGHEHRSGGIALHPGTGRVAALRGDAVALWTHGVESGQLSLAGYAASVTFGPSGHNLAVGLTNGSIEVWLLDDEAADLRVLDGHASAVTGVSLSTDGRLLASRARDGSVCLWETASWELLSEYDVGPGRSDRPHIAFSGEGYEIATSAGDDLEIELIRIELATLQARGFPPGTVHYANAKVVLLGDSGVGKSGLGLVLAGHPFEPTESTHQRNVYQLSVTTAEDVEPPERREVFLWDLAGQPGYRLLHQLHLRDVAVAALVFDAKSELDPLGGVSYWARALRQSEHHGGVAGAARARRILVAARLDRGRPHVSDAEIDDLRRKFDVTEYVMTSAKEGIGVADLRRRIDRLIDWSAITKVSSTGLFDAIRAFLLEKRHSDVLLARVSDLQQQFAETGVDLPPDIDAEFRSSVERAEARGLLRRLSFGDFVLLRPEILDAYAASVVHAAGRDEAGLGAIGEDEVRAGEFFVPSDVRIQDKATEEVLLLATIEDLLGFEIALREDSDDGSYLVFPTESTRRIEIPSSYRPWCVFEFEGSLAHIWATLVVRLAHSGVFTPNVIAGNGVVLFAAGQRFAIARDLTDPGRGRLQLFRHNDASPDIEPILDEFVASHLRRRAAQGTFVRSAVIACGECRFAIPDAVLELLIGQRVIRCPRCGAEVDRGKSTAPPTPDADIGTLNAAADRERSRLVDRVTAEGKATIHEFDVFLAHNTADKRAVIQIDSRLRDYGISTWLDADQVPPGRWFQDILQEAIGRVRTAAIFLGPDGLGPWERLELRTFVSRCVEDHIPVIPVLLPGAQWPAESAFLRELNGVSFERSLEEDDAFIRLVWGITGDRGLRDRLLKERTFARLSPPV